MVETEVVPAKVTNLHKLILISAKQLLSRLNDIDNY